jgi:serine phosphatase RsbU (regulator of sigma subunit)
MNQPESAIKEKNKGSIGRRIYPLRVVGYWMAIATILLVQWRYKAEFSTVALVFCGWVLVYPHLGFLYYRRRGSSHAAEQHVLLADMFWIGWISALVFYSPALAAPFAIANSATNFSMGGMRLFLLGLLTYTLGLLSAGLLTGWEHIAVTEGYAMIPAFLYLFAGSHYIGFLSYVYGTSARKSKKQIAEQNARLLEQTSELMVLNEEISQQAEEISAQRQNIEAQHQLLMRRNRNISESMAYAQRIQQAILPQKSEIAAVLPQSFVWFSPKEVVSGDFYWFARTEQQMLIAAADCTGHGIPGAFMSLIGNDLLHEIVSVRGITRPDWILEELRIGIGKVLRQHETLNQDGMEIGICAIDTENGQPAIGKGNLYFAGAGIPLYYVTAGTVHMLRGDKILIGGRNRFGAMQFQLHQMPLQAGMSFYLFSDGYTDQFGGSSNRKFGRKRLEKLLADIHPLPMPQQEASIRQTIENWRLTADEKQLDDIIAIGVQI